MEEGTRLVDLYLYKTGSSDLGVTDSSLTVSAQTLQSNYTTQQQQFTTLHLTIYYYNIEHMHKISKLSRSSGTQFGAE